MKLLSLKFQGFGPYTQEQTFTFPTARKVAILGTNGAGKTFLLDTVPAALFKSTPNRKGAFYENFSGNDAFIDLTFELNGDTYRAKRLINAVSRTQKAFLWKNGEALNDGKDAAFTAEIQKIGLNETAFMAAIYQSQNGAGNVMTMDVDSRIKLLSIILDLMKFDTDHAKTVEAFREVSREIDGLKLRKQEIERQIPNIPLLNELATDVKIQLQSAATELASIDKQIEEAVQRVANAQANAQGVEDLQREAANLEAEIQADQKLESDLNERIKNNQTLILDRRAEIEKAVLTITVNRKLVEDEQANIQADQVAIQATQGVLDGWNEAHRNEVAELNQKQADERVKLNAAQAIQHEFHSTKAKLVASKSSAEAQIESLKPSTQLIDRVPCAGMQINTSCELLKNAHDNHKKISDLMLEIARVEKLLEATNAEIESHAQAVTAQMKVVADIQDSLDSVMAKRPPVEYTEKIQTLNARISDSNRQISAANQNIKDAQPLADFADKLATAAEKVADYEAQLVPVANKIKVNSEALATKRSKIAEASDIEATIAAASREKESLAASKAEIDRKQKTATETLGRINADLKRADELALEAQKLQSEIVEQSATLAEIQILRDGLGPKGAKNVKIDAAGKAITERANRLIRIGLGPQFSLFINTLRELQSKDENGDPEVRETLELKIIDNNTGEEKLIENLSGGEKAMAGLVFSLSLAVEQRESSGLDVRTLILDEPSAGLSEENSLKYLDMLDAVLDETGIEQVFFISHMPTMQNLADASIFVRKGQDGESSKVEVLS